MGISRRRVAAYALVAFFALGVGVAAAAHISGTSEIDNGVPLVAPDGMTVTVDGNTQALLEDFTPTSGTVDVTTEAGNVTFFSSGDAQATIHKDNITGTWTNVANIDASSNTITIDPEDKDSVVVGGTVDAFAWRDNIAADDGVVDFVYSGPSGQSRVTVQGVAADSDFTAVDADTGTALDTGTSNAGGSVTFDTLPNSEHDVVIQSGHMNVGTLAVASIHTTDSDFRSGTVNNLDVVGSGNSASVSLPTEPFEYNPFDVHGGGPTDSPQFIGDRGGDDIVHAEVRASPSRSGTISTITPTIASTEGSDYGATVDIYVAEGEVPDTTLQEGMLVKSGWDPDWSTGPQSIDLDSGFEVESGTNYSIAFVTSGSDSDGSNDLLRIEVSQGTFSDGMTRYFGSSTAIEDNAANVTLSASQPIENETYLSDTHIVERAEQAFINLTLQDAHADYRIEFGGSGSWQTAASGTLSTTANHTIDISGRPAETQWRANVTLFNESTAATVAELHDEGIQFNARTPSIDNSTADPVDPVEQDISAFTIDMEDADFPLAQSDQLSAELWLGGSNVGTDTLNSNGTASVSYDPDLGQTVDYAWNVSDDYGQTQVSDTFTITTPGNVTFREEHNASQIITGVDTTITFYSTDATIVVQRSDSNADGNVSLNGLPDKEFVAVVESDDHYTRRVYIESIYEQQDIFLLNETEVPGEDAINTTFVFEDRTGEFNPENTTLRIQRALDVNNDDNFTWLTVAGDFWGAASEFPFTGEENARYRLIVENQAGDRRVLGTHIPVADGTKTIINGEIRFEAENATGRYFDANLSVEDENIQVLYQDPTEGTGDIRVRIWQLGNQSNVIHDQQYTNSPYGRLFTTVDLTSEQAEKSWIVRYDATHDEDGDMEGQVPVGTGINVTLPADPWLLAAFGVIGLTMIGTLYGPRTYLIGSWVLVIAAAGMTAFGILAVPWAGILVALAIAAGGTFYKEALP